MTMIITENESPYEIGKKYHVRTVTMAIAGTLKDVYEKELVFENASWVADSGRFSEYLKNPKEVVRETEPFKHDVIVNREAVIDATEMDEVCTEAK